ncbi:activity-regulated cytoskeleton associated protein 2-like [Rhagoletis pomonella]|uniref:activity-regulated cytoskeleton associated protein 2-like n=1 Tax=Rhagoletis pomonella TaxID=28610 RepID=UPI0017863073|nr:activity-regulated cytoskeleton associated protein 2-like [Rhagoletis pomonella]
MTQFTTEQFERLMQAVGHFNTRAGSFSNCTARYGGERESTKVEEFIAAVATFKAVEKINDADAIIGMPMILEGDAAEWWRGVQEKAKAFDDVVRMLREAFSPLKPSWRIYGDIFECKQQKNEPTDTFVRKKRALFSQLTNVPNEADQIDILFGMLHLQIRDRVSRKRINTFDDLLNEAREAELTLREHKTPTVNADKAVVSTSAMRFLS